MSEYRRQQLPDDLEPVVSRLLDKRAYADPLELDQRKQRLLARLQPGRARQWSLRAHVATALTVVGFVAGSGGAIALANGGSSSGQGGAAIGQYCPSKDRDHGRCEHHPYHCQKHDNCKHEHHEDHVDIDH